MLEEMAAHRPLIFVFVVALAVRIGLLLIMPNLYPEGTDKTGRYDPIAISLMRGQGFSLGNEPTAVAGPVYPAFLATAYSLWGFDLFRLRVLLSVLDAAQCTLFFFVARQHFGVNAAIMTAVFLACCPYFIIQIYSADLDTLILFLMAAFISCWTCALNKRASYLQAISGALCGITALCRPVTLFLPLFLAPVFLIRYRDCRMQGVKHFVLFAMSAFLVVSPWIYRNHLRFQRFIPVQTLGGLHLYMATGQWDDEGSWSPEQDSRYYQLAWREITGNTRGYARRAVSRLAEMWYLTHSGRYKEYLKIVNFSLLTLAVLGALINRSNWRSQAYLVLIVLYFVAVHSLLLTIFRYMLATIPILAMFAASYLETTGWAMARGLFSFCRKLND